MSDPITSAIEEATRILAQALLADDLPVGHDLDERVQGKRPVGGRVPAASLAS